MDNYTVCTFVTGLVDDIRRQPKSVRGDLLTLLRLEVKRQTTSAAAELAYELRASGTSPGVVASLLSVSENTAFALMADHAKRNKLPMPTRRRNTDDVSDAVTLPSAPVRRGGS